MRVTSLWLNQFRNYNEEKIYFDKNIIVLYGKNGQGKTNVLEALYLCSIGKSYRNSLDSDMICWEKEEASVITDFMLKGVQQQIKIILPKKGKKKVSINETPVLQKELLGTLNTVLFAPEDLQIIKGSPKLRRRFLDMEISQANPLYYHTLLKYNRSIMQRNLLLKNMRKKGRVDISEWDSQIADSAAILVRKRLEALQKINMLANLMHRKITEGKENLYLQYEQSYFIEGKDSVSDMIQTDWYLNKLQENLEEDIYHMSTSIGPHRDDMSFIVNDMDLKKYGSQGQQRTAILALKLSELEYIKSEVGEYPILLLDDVMSELDNERQQSLLKFIKNRIQTLITTTTDDPFRELEDCLFLPIENGRVKKDVS